MINYEIVTNVADGVMKRILIDVNNVPVTAADVISGTTVGLCYALDMITQDVDGWGISDIIDALIEIREDMKENE